MVVSTRHYVLTDWALDEDGERVRIEAKDVLAGAMLRYARTEAEAGWAGLRAGLLTLGTMIMVLGGRVTPGFTRNAMVQSGFVRTIGIHAISQKK